MPYVQLESGNILETDDVSLWPEAKRLSAAKGKAALRAQGREQLLATLKPGDTILCILRHVSRSGMSRRIDFYARDPSSDSGLLYLTQQFAWLLDEKVSHSGGMIVGGCGMDMGFHIVYKVGATLWRKGTPSPHGTRNGEPDSEGGYALKYRWI